MIGQILILLGALVLLLSAVGSVSFGEVLARKHALAMGATFGLLLILVGVVVNLESVNDITSVVLAGVLHLLASPPASNMLSRAVYLTGGMPVHPDIIDEGAEPLGVKPAPDIDRR